MFGLSEAVVKIGAAVLAVLLILVAVYFKGRHDVQVKFDLYEAEVKAAADAQEAEAKRVDAKNKKLFEDTKNAYNRQLSTLRAYYSMRSVNAGSGLVPQVSRTAAGTDGYSPDNLPAPAILASQCAETTLNLLVLQNWVRGVANNAE